MPIEQAELKNTGYCALCGKKDCDCLKDQSLTRNQPEKNQCDGCQRGLKLQDGDHYGRHETGGRLVMACTKDRYVDEKKCKSSPLCSHNTNNRDLDKPCSISATPEVPEWEKDFETLISLNFKDRGVNRESLKDWIRGLISKTRNQTLEEAAEAIEKGRFHIYTNPKDARERGLNIINATSNGTISTAQTTIRSLKK